jgi:hypothetical protein
MGKLSWVPVVQYDPGAPHWLQNIPIGMLIVLVFLFVSVTVFYLSGTKKEPGKQPPKRSRRARPY